MVNLFHPLLNVAQYYHCALKRTTLRFSVSMYSTFKCFTVRRVKQAVKIRAPLATGQGRSACDIPHVEAA